MSAIELGELESLFSRTAGLPWLPWAGSAVRDPAAEAWERAKAAGRVGGGGKGIPSPTGMTLSS